MSCARRCRRRINGSGCPRVRGLAIERAEAKLADRYLRSRRDGKSQPDAKCVVLRRSPPAGTLQPPTTVIVLTVTRSHPLTKVPDVVALTREEAEHKIRAARLTPKVVDSCAGLQDCLVVSQDPPVPRKVPKNTVVTIDLGGGIPVSVPNVVGMEEANGVDELKGVGLGSRMRGGCQTGVACVVAEQSPPAERPAIRGTVVTLTLAPKEQPVVVPDVVGKSPDAAANELSAAELDPAASRCPSWATCLVAEQVPKGGEEGRKG